MTSYQQEYQRSTQDVEAFWLSKAENIHWFKPPTTALAKDENGMDRWFVDGELNTCYLALDYHIDNGRADNIALIYDSPVTGNKQQFSYASMRDEVATLAGGIEAL